jgi:hypothetical protein
VGGIGHQNYVAVKVATRPVVSAHHQDAGELTVRAGRRLQSDGVHARDCQQHLLQFVLHL